MGRDGLMIHTRGPANSPPFRAEHLTGHGDRCHQWK